MEQGATNQYLTFLLQGERFAVAVCRVREILDLVPICRVPHLPDFVSGVINLRGKVLPVVDLRLRFGLAAPAPTRDTCIIVLEIDHDGGLTEVGALVDAVQEVIVLGADKIEPPPRLGSGLRTEFLAGMGITEQGFIILLQIDRIFAAEEQQLLCALPQCTENALNDRS